MSFTSTSLKRSPTSRPDALRQDPAASPVSSGGGGATGVGTPASPTSPSQTGTKSSQVTSARLNFSKVPPQVRPKPPHLSARRLGAEGSPKDGAENGLSGEPIGPKAEQHGEGQQDGEPSKGEPQVASPAGGQGALASLRDTLTAQFKKAVLGKLPLTEAHLHELAGLAEAVFVKAPKPDTPHGGGTPDDQFESRKNQFETQAGDMLKRQMQMQNLKLQMEQAMEIVKMIAEITKKAIGNYNVN